jgi:hypothetical protein
MPEVDLFDTIKVSNWHQETVINQAAVKKEWTGQHAKLMRLFQSAPNQWISLPEILALGIAQYGARILELRAGGENIENKTAWVNKQRHSWFMWVG